MHSDKGVDRFCKNDTNYGEREIDEIVEECVIQDFIVFGLNFMKQSA